MPSTYPAGTASLIALPDAVGIFPEPRQAAFSGATAEHWRLADRR